MTRGAVGPVRGGLRRLATTAAAVALVAAVGVSLTAVDPLPAGAASQVTVSPATADPDYATSLTVSGTGFQDVDGGFGGIYVLFGTVDSHWQPSAGGVSGTDYLYVEDAETADNHGYLKFVSYSNGSTLAEANGGIISPDGSWSTTLIVPGAGFSASGQNGQTTPVNCLQVQCGVITIGAHGVVDPENETFTPVEFAVPAQPSSPVTTTLPPAPTTTPTPPPTTTVAPSTSPPTSPATTVPSTTTTTTAVPGPARGGGPKTGDPPKAALAARATTQGSAGPLWWIAILIVAVLAAAGTGLWLRRRRHAAGTGE